jgi:hypothetical protein
MSIDSSRELQPGETVAPAPAGTEQVILYREPNRRNRLFPPEPPWRARKRAEALSHLHGCQYEFGQLSNTWHVHANAYYRKPRED